MAEYDLESWTSPDLVKADDMSVLDEVFFNGEAIQIIHQPAAHPV